MGKKLSLLVAAAAVLLVALPGAAAASTLTSKSGVVAPVNTILEGTSLSPVKITSTLLGTIECQSLDTEGVLTKNSGGTFEIQGSFFAAAGCTNNGKAATVTTFEVKKLASSTSGSGSLNFESKIDVAGLTCNFIATSVPFSYIGGSGQITFTKAGTVDASPATCGTATFDAAFVIELNGFDVGVILD